MKLKGNLEEPLILFQHSPSVAAGGRSITALPAQLTLEYLIMANDRFSQQEMGDQPHEGGSDQ